MSIWQGKRWVGHLIGFSSYSDDVDLHLCMYICTCCLQTSGYVKGGRGCWNSAALLFRPLFLLSSGSDFFTILFALFKRLDDKIRFGFVCHNLINSAIYVISKEFSLQFCLFWQWEQVIDWPHLKFQINYNDWPHFKFQINYKDWPHFKFQINYNDWPHFKFCSVLSARGPGSAVQLLWGQFNIFFALLSTSPSS